MNKKIILVLIILLLSNTTFVWAAPHCYRQDISRVNNNYSQSNVGFVGEFSTGTTYDYIVQPGTKYVFGGIQPSVWECGNGFESSQKDFGAILDRLNTKILVTNSGAGLGGPQTTSFNACIDADGILCYKNGDEYIPAQGMCDVGGALGGGNDAIINYEFTMDDIGAHELTAEIGAVSPVTDNIYDTGIMYMAIPGSKATIFVGSPAMLVFGPEQEVRLGTYDETGNIKLTLLYTVMNRSFFDNTIVNYTVNCPTGITCNVDLTYIGWPVKSEQEIIIPVDVIILKNKAPAEFVINMEMNFSADNITDCDPSQEGDYCHTQAQLTEIKLGLLDKQDFQVKTMDKAYSDSCIGLDGVVGVTGEEYAPKVNLTFGNDTDPLISIDECDELTIEKVANPDGVYCSQKEFLVELAEKISTIGELREEIQALESAGQYSEANDKRNEENKYSAFSSYLRAQDFSDALNTLDAFNSNLIFQDTGLENWENGGISEQQNYLKEIYNSTNGVKFIIEKNGVNLDTTTITPGIYTVKIDMNELEEITTSDYLILADGTLNPTIDIKVTLADGIKPKLDWFFYNEGYEDDFEELFKNIGLQKTTNAYSTNILNRGEIIKFDERDGDLLNASFFQTYAYPLLVKITGDSTGNTNAKIKLKNNEAPAGDFFEKDMFTEWTGVGSSKGDGCETISTSTEDTTLPYRVPDISISNDTFAFEDLSHNLAQVAPNSKMLLSTVLYLPYNTTTGDTLKIETQMPLYHSGESCTNPPCNLLLDENMSNNKVFELSDVLEKIRNKSVCVYRGIGPSLENKWSLFWNEQEIVKELDALTLMITDVSVCN